MFGVGALRGGGGMAYMSLSVRLPLTYVGLFSGPLGPSLAWQAPSWLLSAALGCGHPVWANVAFSSFLGGGRRPRVRPGGQRGCLCCGPAAGVLASQLGGLHRAVVPVCCRVGGFQALLPGSRLAWSWVGRAPRGWGGVIGASVGSVSSSWGGGVGRVVVDVVDAVGVGCVSM